jgi:TonB family protein
MRVYTVFAALVVMSCSTYAAKPSPITMDEARRKRLLLVEVRPDYPEEAKRNFWTGRGIFELRFDHETGRLREVHVVKSTGHGILDRHAIAALKRWRAKPRSIHALRFPITFTYTRG